MCKMVSAVLGACQGDCGKDEAGWCVNSAEKSLTDESESIVRRNVDGSAILKGETVNISNIGTTKSRRGSCFRKLWNIHARYAKRSLSQRHIMRIRSRASRCVRIAVMCRRWRVKSEPDEICDE